MKNTPLYLILSIALITSACASAAGNVRPETITGGEAVGESFNCTDEKLSEDLSPFTVDWGDGDRASLESAMRRGVAVVKMTCEGPKVLKACMVVGDYAYAGISRKTKLVKMKDEGSAAVNLGATISPVFRAALSQGRSLMLAYTIAGTEATTVTTVGPWQLKGRCDGATHFVFEAQLGAFAMETAEAGASATATDLLIGDASTATDSSKETRSTDGDPVSCEGSSFKDIEKKEGCAALMRVDLMYIDPNAERPTEEPDLRIDPVVRASGCPDGYAWDNSACLPEAKVEARLCKKDDAAGCKTQCELGSLESCDRWAETLIWDAQSAELEHDDWQDAVVARGDVVEGWATYVDVMTAACDDGMPHPCAVMGYHWVGKWDEPRALENFGAACGNGDSGSCYTLGDVEPRPDALLEVSKEARLPYLEAGCNKGVSVACGMWSDLFLDDWSYDQLEFSPVAAKMAARACYGGSTNYCWTAAGLQATTQERCVEMLASGSRTNAELEHAEGICQKKFSKGLAGSDLQTSLLLSVACDAGRASTCEYMDDNGLRINLDDYAAEGE